MHFFPPVYSGSAQHFMNADFEASIRALVARQDRDGAASLAIRQLGPEVLGFLAGVLRDVDEASDVFSIFSEELMRHVLAFRGDASFRTWAYVVARSALSRHRRDPYRRRRADAASGVFSALVAEVRTATVTHLRTETREGLRALRDELTDEDRELLVLRVDRDLSFEDVVLVFAEGEALGDVERKRRAALLRKRFERVKHKLRTLAEQRGLLGRKDAS